MVEVDGIVLSDDVLVTNNTNTMNSLVAIPTTEMEPSKSTCYAIPEKFDSFKSIEIHCYIEVRPRENCKNKSWRRHLSSSEKEGFNEVIKL